MSTPKLCPNTLSAWIRLLRAHTHCMNLVDERLKSANLPPLTWYDVLYELHSSEHGYLRPYEIEQRILLKQYNLSRLIDRLENEKLVEKTRCKVDGRGLFIKITEAGTALLERMWPIYAEMIDQEFGSRLEQGEAKQLAALLEKLVPPRSAPADD